MTSNIGTILDLLEDHSIRGDGRRPYELRRIEHRFDMCKTATGSIWLRQGGTSVVCGVYGPHEVDATDLRHQCPSRHSITGQLSVNCQVNGNREALRGLPIELSTIASLVKQALESTIIWDQSSRSVFDVYVDIETIDGSVLATVMNAVSFATMSTAIPMKDILTCCTASLLRGKYLVDVDAQEESVNGPTVTVCICSKIGLVVWLEVGSKYGRSVHGNDFKRLTDAAMEGCRAVLFVADSIVESEWKDRIMKWLRVHDD